MDYRDFKIGNEPAPGQRRDRSCEWWTKSGAEMADAVSATLVTMESGMRARMTMLMRAARLYGNLPALGIPGYSWSKPVFAAGSGVQGGQGLTYSGGRLSFNLVLSAIDTITSKMAKNKPRPLFLTTGGNFQHRRKAQRLNRFCDGLFYQNDAHTIGSLAFRNGCIDGDGVVHIFDRYGKVGLELVPVSELYADEVEGLHGRPRQIHRVMNIDRGVLEGITGKKGVVEEANRAPMPPTGLPTISDAVQARESWHLPSHPEAKDGRHAITISGHTLLSEPWPFDWFPFAGMQWSPPKYGYWAQGLAEQLAPIQLEINKLLWSFSEAYRLAGMSVIFLENGSKVVKSHLTNLPGTIVNYSGTPPQYATPGILPPEAYAHFESLVAKGYEQAGISQLSATSKKPAGLDSGRALREYNDIESDRFMTIGQRYEKFYLDMAKKSIAVVRGIAEREGDYRVMFPSHGAGREENWSDINLDEDEYIMQCFPVSSLPNEPAGRFQTIQEWVQAGWYTPRQGKRLMDFPDIEAVDSLARAAEDHLSQVLDGIVDDGKYIAPDPFDDLELAYSMALEYYQQGKVNGLEEERMEMLRAFMAGIDRLIQQAQPAEGMAPGAAGATPGAPDAGVPQGMPAPAPVTDLLPNAPGARA